MCRDGEEIKYAWVLIKFCDMFLYTSIYYTFTNSIYLGLNVDVHKILYACLIEIWISMSAMKHTLMICFVKVMEYI